MGEKRAKRTTIIEVARMAGVSTATAGRVLGGYGYASQDIREKVRATAESLGYRPNSLARSLITGQTQTIGVVAGDVESPFYASILRGIADVARSKGFGLVVTNSDEIFQREREAIGLLVEKQVDGLIVTPSNLADPGHLEDIVASGCPVVQIDRVVRGLVADAVTVNSAAAARECVSHLIGAGHRRIAMVAELERSELGDVRSFLERASLSAAPAVSLYPSWQRLLGYLEAHRAAGVPVDPALVRRVGAYSAGAAREETIDLLSGGHAPTALFTADGLMSAGVMDALSALQLDIPGDISLACFDDLDWMRFVRPGITAVAQPLNEMGRAAARLILARIGGEKGAPQHLVLPARLVPRHSVKDLGGTA